QVSPRKRKELQHGHNVSSTRSSKNQLEKKGIVNNSDERNASLFSNLFFYQTTNPQGGKNFETVGAEKSKPGPKILKEMPGLSKVLDQLEEKEAGATPKNTMPGDTGYFADASCAKRENR